MKASNAGSWKEKAQRLGTDVYILWLALRDPRTPWYAKALAAVVVAYAVSPIDLIPDFIPVLGYIDDLVLVPAGIYLALKLVPREVIEKYRQQVKPEAIAGTSRWVAAALIIALWLLVVYLVVSIIWL